jgi:hypothetical protein
MNRRSFIKGLIALASAPAIGKYVNIFKTEGAREGIQQVASQGVDFFNSVIKKVMDEGNLVNESDRIQTFKHPDRPDINVEVDLTSGSSSVYFDTDQGTKAGAEIVKDIEMGPNYSELLENEEVYKTGAGGEVYKDVDEQITGGITNLEKFLKGKKGFAAGGRVGMFRGGIPKGLQAALRTIMSKYGDDAITTADKAPQPEKTIQEQIMDFNARNRPDEITMESREILDVPAVPGGFKLSREKLKQNFPELDEDMIDQMMEMEPDLQVRIIKMLENRRLDPDAYDNLLDTKGDTLEFQGEFDKITRRKNNADGGSVDGDVSLTVIKIPDISESGVESLFKRR